MGWTDWLWSKQPEPDAHSRSGRQICWESKDAYFSCLDNAGVIKAGDEGNACEHQNTAYHTNCAKSWIDYFNQRRVIQEAQKDRLAQAQMQAKEARR